MPSISRSSSPVIWPLIWMVAPRRATLRDGLLPNLGEVVELNGADDGEAGEGEAAGGSATACCLDHIYPPFLGRVECGCSGWEGAVRIHVVSERGARQLRM